ncbi:hypothetical protein [Bythopirellula goksoeyrii]|uniref:Uncharacterized protein n=1 Tax=Bythopirellula goksoeyrii TaxID=1400387 RepID=A0A5B9QHY0_9BACT|nr:hypothetical protein [Bythopirellula goksoeyrii]QEG37190.1 hypothetical protein Pr1d_45310 [Bythopirellula goksoeyrii]
MSFDLLTYQHVGDKKNSDFFEEYRVKIYERRLQSGLDQLLGKMRGVVIQVETGDAISYLEELYLMSPYRLAAAYRSDTHNIYVMVSETRFPRIFVIEPLDKNFEDDVKRLNMIYPLARAKPNARYIGEIFHTTSVRETCKVLESHNVRFVYDGDEENRLYTNKPFAFTEPSDFTFNRVGYTEADLEDYDELNLGTRFELTQDQLAELEKQAELGKEAGIHELLRGIDHMATRILAGEREDAILEFLTMSNYYFWGAYNIHEMNSSTNVNRNSHVEDDKESPAKVFTANNTPSFINSFENLPMPTEDFVRNFGRRMHHIAYEVVDGDHPSGVKNVDYVVGKLGTLGVPFLAHVVGECKDSPDLKQIFSKHSKYSILITEYVERCHKFKGFFTKQNVASLTEAAGKDERYTHGHVFD